MAKEAVARGRNLRVSHKDLTELGRFISGRSAEDAQARLQRVIEKEEAVPYTRFNRDLSHKSGIGPGRYPEKAARELLKVLNSAVKNAEDQEIDPETLRVYRVITNKGRNQFKPDRQRGRTMKLAHVTVKLRGKGPSAPIAEPEPEHVTQEDEQEDEQETEAPETSTESESETDYEELVSGTVSDLKDALEDFDGDLNALLEAEKNNKNRKTAVEAIEAAIGEEE